MSAVFMCDNCGNLFSVNQRGWRAFTEQWNGKSEDRDLYNNAHNHGAVTRHIGPCCNLTGSTVTPRIAIEPAKEDN